MKKQITKTEKQNPISHFAHHTSQKGITLIALIITVIVMLILVGVSVTVALNGGLFSTAQNAKERTQEERDKELGLDEGKVEIDGVWYDSMEDYVNNKPSATQPEKVETGTPIGSTDELKAKQVKVGDLVYVANSDGQTASVYGIRKDTDDYTGVTHMNYEFAITANSIQISPKVKIGEVVYTVNNIGAYAFYGMTNLESVTIPSSVTSIPPMSFTNCSNLTEVTFLGNVPTIQMGSFTGTAWETTIRENNNGLLVVNGILFDGMSVTGNITIPGTVNKIATNAFMMIQATSITIPSTVTTVESNAISSMTNTLTTINVSWAEGSKPSGWADDWNGSSATVVYGYTI